MASPSAEALAEHRALVGRIEDLLPTVDEVARAFVATFARGGTVYSFGNGGSAADAQHLAAELLGRYRRDRRALAATSLAADSSALTCIGNDFSFDDIFARQLEALATASDTAVAFTTSGRSENVVRGLAVARARGAQTVLFGGGTQPRAAADHADLQLIVASDTTARVQELHLLLLHLVVEQVDAWAVA